MVETGSGPPAAAASSQSWRTPSEANQAKYSLVPLPESFQLTHEEETLLGTYETIRLFEKEAVRLKEEAARAKLAAKDAEFKQQRNMDTTSGRVKKIRKKKSKQAKTSSTENDGSDADDMANNDDDDNESDESSAGDANQTLNARREAKLAAMREELEVSKQTAEAKEEAQRAELLAQNELDVDEPLLKRKTMDSSAEPSSSLIANIGNVSTPPHDFSQKLGIKAWHGKVLFPTSAEETKWTPPSTATNFIEGAFSVQLDDFDVAQAQHGSGNNTCAIKFHAPSDSKRFSINIATPDHGDFHNILFHFNPRQHERGGQVVINDKHEGIWGQAIAIPLSQLPLIFGQTACTLLIQIHGDGFDVFVEDKHCARLEHRRELPAKKGSLVLQFPSTDDYGSPENWVVYKVWWGNKPIMAKGDLSGVAGVNVFNSIHPRKLFVRGLQPLSAQHDLELRRAELERAFRKYGGDRGVAVLVPPNSTFAFVEMETERQADLALHEMADTYRLNRARRSRHEALQEERAAAAAAKRGEKKEVGEWD